MELKLGKKNYCSSFINVLELDKCCFAFCCCIQLTLWLLTIADNCQKEVNIEQSQILFGPTFSTSSANGSKVLAFKIFWYNSFKCISSKFISLPLQGEGVVQVHSLSFSISISFRSVITVGFVNFIFWVIVTIISNVGNLLTDSDVMTYFIGWETFGIR